MSNYKETAQEVLDEFAKLQNEFRKKAEITLKQVTTGFFDANPAITTISWTQYTPYFNDGDTCEFNVHDPLYTNAPEQYLDDAIREELEDDVKLEDDTVVFSTYSYYEDTIEGVSNEDVNFFSKFICSNVMRDVLYDLFGDHARIIATRAGFDVQEYYHD